MVWNTSTHIGLAYSRYGDFPFSILDADRLMNLYVVGQTGTGKSPLLGNIARQGTACGKAHPTPILLFKGTS